MRRRLQAAVGLPVGSGPHLDVDQQLPQAPRGHHRGAVELADVAVVQSDVVIRREPLEQVTRYGALRTRAMTSRGGRG